MRPQTEEERNITFYQCYSTAENAKLKHKGGVDYWIYWCDVTYTKNAWHCPLAHDCDIRSLILRFTKIKLSDWPNQIILRAGSIQSYKQEALSFCNIMHWWKYYRTAHIKQPFLVTYVVTLDRVPYLKKEETYQNVILFGKLQKLILRPVPVHVICCMYSLFSRVVIPMQAEYFLPVLGEPPVRSQQIM